MRQGGVEALALGPGGAVESDLDPAARFSDST